MYKVPELYFQHVGCMDDFYVSYIQYTMYTYVHTYIYANQRGNRMLEFFVFSNVHCVYEQKRVVLLEDSQQSLTMLENNVP